MDCRIRLNLAMDRIEAHDAGLAERGHLFRQALRVETQAACRCRLPARDTNSRNSFINSPALNVQCP